MVLKDIKASITADSYHHTKGVFTLRWGFYYTHGMTVDHHIAHIKSKFPTAKIIDSGTEWKSFKGGGSVAENSHWWVKFSVS